MPLSPAHGDQHLSSIRGSALDGSKAAAAHVLPKKQAPSSHRDPTGAPELMVIGHALSLEGAPQSARVPHVAEVAGTHHDARGAGHDSLEHAAHHAADARAAHAAEAQVRDLAALVRVERAQSQESARERREASAREKRLEVARQRDIDAVLRFERERAAQAEQHAKLEAVRARKAEAEHAKVAAQAAREAELAERQASARAQRERFHSASTALEEEYLAEARAKHDNVITTLHSREALVEIEECKRRDALKVKAESAAIARAVARESSQEVSARHEAVLLARREEADVKIRVLELKRRHEAEAKSVVEESRRDAAALQREHDLELAKLKAHHATLHRNTTIHKRRLEAAKKAEAAQLRVEERAAQQQLLRERRRSQAAVARATSQRRNEEAAAQVAARKRAAAAIDAKQQAAADQRGELHAQFEALNDQEEALAKEQRAAVQRDAAAHAEGHWDAQEAKRLRALHDAIAHDAADHATESAERAHIAAAKIRVRQQHQLEKEKREHPTPDRAHRLEAVKQRLADAALEEEQENITHAEDAARIEAVRARKAESEKAKEASRQQRDAAIAHVRALGRLEKRELDARASLLEDLKLRELRAKHDAVLATINTRLAVAEMERRKKYGALKVKIEDDDLHDALQRGSARQLRAKHAAVVRAKRETEHNSAERKRQLEAAKRSTAEEVRLEQSAADRLQAHARDEELDELRAHRATLRHDIAARKKELEEASKQRAASVRATQRASLLEEHRARHASKAAAVAAVAELRRADRATDAAIQKHHVEWAERKIRDAAAERAELKAQLEEAENQELAALDARHAELVKAAEDRSAHLALERERAHQQKLEAAAAAAKEADVAAQASVDDVELARIHKLRDEAHAAFEARKEALAREKHERAARLHENDLELHAEFHRIADKAQHTLSNAVKRRREREAAARDAALAKRDEAVREKRLATWTERAELHTAAEEERKVLAARAFQLADGERAATVTRALRIAAAKAERASIARLEALGEVAVLAGLRLLRQREAALKHIVVQESRASHQMHILRVRHLQLIPFEARQNVAAAAAKGERRATSFHRAATALPASSQKKPTLNLARKGNVAARGQLHAAQSLEHPPQAQAQTRRHVEPHGRALSRASTAKLKLD